MGKGRKLIWVPTILLTLLISGCSNTDTRVDKSLENEAQNLVKSVADATYRNGFRDRDALEETLKVLPDRKLITRSVSDFQWKTNELHAVASFSNSAQRTEAEAAGRYSALACGELVINLKEVKMNPIECPENVPLHYGSHEPVVYNIPRITSSVDLKQ